MKAVFLDRDGTINREVNYLHRIEDLELLPNVEPALFRLLQLGFQLVVVTNQAGVARGYFTERHVQSLHDHLQNQLKDSGVEIAGFYYCPHHPTEGLGTYRLDCECRKPKPGMLVQAAQDLNIDLTQSYMVGDRLSDLQAGQGAGCRSILVRTGYGNQQEAKAKGYPVCSDLMAAADWIAEQTSWGSIC